VNYLKDAGFEPRSSKMPSRARKPKAVKGTVQVKASNGRLQLVFTHAGQRYYLSPGYSDTPKYRRAAERKAAIIEEDIEKERFDSTLDKYRPEPKAKPKGTATVTQRSLQELWEDFIEFKRPQCSPSTMHKQYGTFTNYVATLPTHDLDRASEILEYCMKEIPPKSCKRFITRLNACCKLAVRAGHITHSPFAGMASDIKIPKGQQGSEDDINPFSVEERDAILEAFRSDQFCSKHARVKHSYYFPFLSFLFKTGCRPSEAIALQWKHIDRNYGRIRFMQAVVEGEDGRVCKAGLKTQERRDFPCNQSLQEFLKEIRPKTCDRESLIFPSPKTGTWINTGNFQDRMLIGAENFYQSHVRQ
jgi:integrase